MTAHRCHITYWLLWTIVLGALSYLFIGMSPITSALISSSLLHGLPMPKTFADIRDNTNDIGSSSNVQHNIVVSTLSRLAMTDSPKPTKRFTDVQDITKVTVVGAQCSEVAMGHDEAIVEAVNYQTTHPKVPISDAEYIKQTLDCASFRRERQYIMYPVNQEEADFPLAFSIIMFKEVELFERLLRAIYRPQNHYCVHVDKKANSSIQLAVKGITGCFDNVFLASQQIGVRWGTYSVLLADLICMGDLLKQKNWKYFINLTGREFPLKTNLDLVKIFKIFNGSNNIVGRLHTLPPGRMRTATSPHPLRLTLCFQTISLKRLIELNSHLSQELHMMMSCV